MNRYLVSSLSRSCYNGANANSRRIQSTSKSVGMMLTPYQQRSSLLHGQSVQVRYNFITDFFQNYKNIVNEDPYFRKSVDDFKLLFGIKPKPAETQQATDTEGYTGPKMEFGTQQQQTGDQQGQQATEQQQQQQGQATEQQQQGQQAGEQKQEKQYASKDEELRDKYKEYYKDYDKRRAEADTMSKIKGEMSPTQKEQLNAAYKETLGVRPPYPEMTKTNYALISTDLRVLAFEERLQLPLTYDPRLQLTDLLEEAIDEADDDHLPDLIILMKQREQELREKGMDPPEVDWDSMTSVEQFEELPDIYKDSFNPTEEELAKMEEYKLPATITDPFEKNLVKKDKLLDRLVKYSEYIPALGGNYLYYYLNRFSQRISRDPVTKLYMDYKDILLPGFELTKFLEISKQKFIPEFIKFFLVGNVVELEEYCSESGLRIVSGFIKAREDGHKVLDDRLMSIENFEYEGIRQTEDEELLFIFTMNVISSRCIRDYLYNVVDGGDNDIISTPMIIALSYDLDANDFGYVVHQISIQHSQSIYL